MTSTMARMITEKSEFSRFMQSINTWFREISDSGGVLALTEGQPGLSDLQVDREVRLQAKVTDGDVSTSLAFQTGKLHVTVENT